MKVQRAARRRLLRLAGALLAAAPLRAWAQAARPAGAASALVRPGMPGWPDESQWEALGRATGGALQPVRSPVAACAAPGADAAACTALFDSALRNPYFVGDEPGLTQTLGWVDAWTSQPSVWAVAARRTADVVAAVDFARHHRVRLVVKGGGHSYQGTSNAPDSLLVWTRRMNATTLHDAFVPAGCAGRMAPSRAVSVGAGAMWGQVYDAVTTRAGGYVQGGGCLTVGVAGLVQSGGFGSFSKAFGLAAASLLEAEVVTADGAVRVANACSEPDLFWALKGGGGGSFGVVTRLTLRVHALPETFGAVNFTVRATSEPAWRRLCERMLEHYAAHLFNPHWGEQIRFRPERVLQVAMVFQGLSRSQAQAAWRPFLDAVEAAPDLALGFAPLKIIAVDARGFWAPSLLKRVLGFMVSDERPGAPEGNVFWKGDQGQVAQVIHGYGSAWLPAALLQPERRGALAEALVEASRHRGVSLHVNKGLAGAPAEVLAAARDTAMNPQVLGAFALAITAAEGPPAWPGVPGREPDAARGRERAQAVARAMAALRRVAPGAGAYLAESDYFQDDWRQAFWGEHHARLAEVKRRYDPEGLFCVHHGVGSGAP